MLINVTITGQQTKWPTFQIEAASEEAAIPLVYSGQGEGNPLAETMPDSEIPFDVKIRPA